MCGGLSPGFDLLFVAKLLEIVVSLPRREKGKKLARKTMPKTAANAKSGGDTFTVVSAAFKRLS
jgi:hypothetical protein